MMIVIVVIVPVPIKASYYERLEKRNANPSTLDSLLPSSYLIHIVPFLSRSIFFFFQFQRFDYEININEMNINEINFFFF